MTDITPDIFTKNRHPIWMRGVLARTAHLNKDRVTVDRKPPKQSDTTEAHARVMTCGRVWRD